MCIKHRFNCNHGQNSLFPTLYHSHSPLNVDFFFVFSFSLNTDFLCGHEYVFWLVDDRWHNVRFCSCWPPHWVYYYCIYLLKFSTYTFNMNLVPWLPGAPQNAPISWMLILMGWLFSCFWLEYSHTTVLKSLLSSLYACAHFQGISYV